MPRISSHAGAQIKVPLLIPSDSPRFLRHGQEAGPRETPRKGRDQPATVFFSQLPSAPSCARAFGLYNYVHRSCDAHPRRAPSKAGGVWAQEWAQSEGDRGRASVPLDRQADRQENAGSSSTIRAWRKGGGGEACVCEGTPPPPPEFRASRSDPRARPQRGCAQISRVRKDMYNDTLNGSTEKRSAELPDAVGPIVQLQEKLYVPVKEYPDFNFVGRILGPRGLTAKQLEAETGCKIMVRGKGSMRDKKKEEQNRGKPNWEHLNEDLHVLITVEDAQNRAEIKLKRAVEEVKKLLVPAAEGEDSLKKMQLMELAILNGTYRDANIKSPTAQAPRIITGPAPVLPPAALRTPTPAGPTIMPLIRQIQTAVMPNGTPHPTAAIVPPGPEAGLIYTPYEYPYTLAPATSILEYPIEPSGVLGAVATKVRRHDMRVHPYQRIVTADRAATGN
ncbi:protein quaking [Gracilinanus agilis]|nr:protein quaking [Gracilinanus agilis]